MLEKHLSTQFDSDLDGLTSALLNMGSIVEVQLQHAITALSDFDRELADKVMARDNEVDAMEVEIDAMCVTVIAKRQPIARDLRLVMATSKAVTNLERAGDEVERIAKRTKHIIEDASAHSINFSEVKLAASMAGDMLRSALDAFARQDAVVAERVMLRDRLLDAEFRAFVRKLTSYMAEDPRSISVALDFLFIAKAIERIGDHATNIAEQIIYVVRGTDIRHSGHVNTLIQK
jgi:phosphate transport system protein